MIIGFGPKKIPFGEVQNDLFMTTDGGPAFILSEHFFYGFIVQLPLQSGWCRCRPFSLAGNFWITSSQEMKSSLEGDGHRRWHHDVSSLFRSIAHTSRCPFKYFFSCDFKYERTNSSVLFAMKLWLELLWPFSAGLLWWPSHDVASPKRTHSANLSVGVDYRCWASS